MSSTTSVTAPAVSVPATTVSSSPVVPLVNANAGKRIVIIGAGGELGRTLVKDAIAQGQHVTVVVRDEAKFRTAIGSSLSANKNIEIVIGSAGDATVLRKAFTGADSVVSALGGFSAMKTYVSDSKTTIDVAVELKVPNLVLTVAAGLLDAPKSSGHIYAKDFLAPIVGDWIHHTTAMFIQIWDLLKAAPSSLNWMIHCPGAIVHQPHAAPKPLVAADDFIGFLCTYEDMSSWTLSIVHSLSTQTAYNHRRIGFGTALPPVSIGLPATLPVWSIPSS